MNGEQRFVIEDAPLPPPPRGVYRTGLAAAIRSMKAGQRMAVRMEGVSPMGIKNRTSSAITRANREHGAAVGLRYLTRTVDGVLYIYAIKREDGA